jgi:hypothetical protein
LIFLLQFIYCFRKAKGKNLQKSISFELSMPHRQFLFGGWRFPLLCLVFKACKGGGGRGSTVKLHNISPYFGNFFWQKGKGWDPQNLLWNRDELIKKSNCYGDYWLYIFKWMEVICNWSYFIFSNLIHYIAK